MCIVMLVIMTESTADVLALGEIAGRPADEKTLAAALRADGLGTGIIPMADPDSYHAFPESLRIILDSGISAGCVVAVLLNLVFNHLGRTSEPSPAPAAPPSRCTDPAIAPRRRAVRARLGGGRVRAVGGRATSRAAWPCPWRG